MFVPAIAFGWWLVSLPLQSVPVLPAMPVPTQDVETAALTQDEGDDEAEAETADDERVLVRTALSPEIVRTALGFLDLPMGAERMMRIGGQRYVFVLEWHFHKQGFVGAPSGWHKGVTVYALVRAPA